MTIEHIQPLNADQWERTRARAKQVIRGRLKPPVRSQFLVIESKYPPLVQWVSSLLLTIVTTAAFVISAGRQIVASGIIVERLAKEYPDRIPPGYVSLAIVAALTLSEFGVLVFGYGARIAPGKTGERLLRFFQFLSVVIAIAGNIAVFALNYAPEVAGLDLLITLAAPVVVIGVGLMIEHRISEAILNRENALKAYRTARSDFDRLNEAPELHKDWFAVWGEIILDGLRVNEGNAALIDAAIETDPKVRQDIVFHEYTRHEWQFSPVNLSSNGTSDTVVKTPKPTPQLDKVLRFWADNPTTFDTIGDRKLGRMLGVSYETVRNARPVFSANGHAAPVEPGKVQP